MASSRLSHSRILTGISILVGTVFVGFGVLPMLNPLVSISFFDTPIPSTENERRILTTFLYTYAVRDVFMGLATYVTVYYGDRKVLGWLQILGGAVAFVDGFVAKLNSADAAWNHWGYAPMLVVLGTMLVGWWDKKEKSG